MCVLGGSRGLGGETDRAGDDPLSLRASTDEVREEDRPCVVTVREEEEEEEEEGCVGVGEVEGGREGEGEGVLVR